MNYFTDGTMPEGFYELPAEWNLAQIKAYQEWWDTMMAGDPKNMRKIRFMPAASGGKGFTPAKSFDFNGMQPFLEWLMTVTAGAFGVSPLELGFSKSSNRATAEEQTEIAKRNSIKSLAYEVEDLINDVMSGDLILPSGQVIKANPDLKFQFMDLDPKDEMIDAQVANSNLNAGLISINDYRREHGAEPIEGADEPYIMTSSGPIWLSDFINSKGQPTQPTTENAPEGNVVPKEELKLWQKKALNDLREGRKFRKFESTVLDDFTLTHLSGDLNKCKTRQEVKDCFATWERSLEKGVNYDVESLYKKLDEVLKD